jgi:DNA-binding NarL/FixJ family response regulator
MDGKFSAAEFAALTERQKQVYELILEGTCNKEMACRLGVTIHTVRYHVHTVLRKLNKANRIELLASLLQG